MEDSSRNQEKVPVGAGGGSVLTRQELEDLHVIQEADEKSYQLTSYDLRLGSCHYIFEDSRQEGGRRDQTKWKLVHIGKDEDLIDLNRDEKGSQKYEVPKSARHTLTIPPYGSAIIELKEIVDTYTAAVAHNTLIVGRFDLKLSQVYQALISQQATQVEPFYQGKLYCFIHNLSGREISMEEGEKVATIEFSYAGEHLLPEQREDLINRYKKNRIKKYTKSLYAHKNQRGIGEVRWFYEQNRLPSDCGLNGLHTKVNHEVTDAVNRFDREFGAYVEKDETLTKIAERVSRRIQENQRSLEILVSVITGSVAFGFGSLIWMFYQELVKVMARQELYNTYLSGKADACNISQIETAPGPYFWLILYVTGIIAAVIVIALIIYFYATRKMRAIDQKVQTAVQRELLHLKDELTGRIDRLSDSNEQSLKTLENINQLYDILEERVNSRIGSQEPGSKDDTQ